MWIGGYAPVTNLYSSALFVGWVVGGLCLVLEKIYRNGIGSAAAGLIGFGTLIIAHHLSLSGDTLEMMRAVLDSNFWLATHVITVTTGYGATFLAGFLAIIYIFRGLLTRTLDAKTADALARMVYGIVCFATLFSFVGTILGGIWADQSWGRFWGWDPKENGALIIVLWNALILHARWGGLVKQRGLMILAIVGNIVTSWSWFGTNLLEVGLHSYGFTSSGRTTLAWFVISQLAIIAIALTPLTKWRSFRAA
jgi:ABC-type transport system involved in cytochrome c biogenesis permease subunit